MTPSVDPNQQSDGSSRHDTHQSNHSHDHGRGAPSARLAGALSVTGLIFIAEVVLAYVTGSLALLADAGHMAADSLGLVTAFVVATLASRPATDRRTWGLARLEVVGAALQAGLLAAVGVTVFIKAIGALLNPAPVGSEGMLAMGIIGLVGNAVSLAILAGGRRTNLNMRAAFLEVLNDALGSVGVIIAALIVATTGWTRADAVVSIAIVVLIVPRAVMLLRDAGAIILGFAPREIDVEELRRHFLAVEHVEAVHDLHVWSVASDTPVLMAHVVVRPECFIDGHAREILTRLQTCAAEHFPVQLSHTTIQIEPGGHEDPGEPCDGGHLHV